MVMVEVVREFLHLAFREFQWFKPRRYGHASLTEPIDPSRLELSALVAYYEEHGHLCVAARTDRDFLWIHPTSAGAPPYTGAISWTTSASSASIICAVERMERSEEARADLSRLPRSRCRRGLAVAAFGR